MLPIHRQSSKLDSNKTQIDYDATCLYPSAMWDQKPVYLEIETGFAFKADMIDVFVEVFNNQTFNQDGDESALLRIKYYNPPNLIFHHLANKEKVKKKLR